MKKFSYNARIILAGAVAMGMALTGCSSQDEPKKPAEPIRLSRAEAEVMQSQSDFALSMLKTLSVQNPGENVGFSPFSAQQALSMLGNGVTGDGQAKFAKTLGTYDITELNALNVRLNETLPMRDPEFVEVKTANGLWMNDIYSFNPGFVGVMRNSYGSESGSYNFGSVDIADIANRWIADKTRNGIKNLLPGYYNKNKDVVFILANALYFNGKWADKFEKSATAPLPFTDSYGKNGKDVLTMSGEKTINYRGFENYSMSSIAFGQGVYNMLLILPDPGVTPDEVLASLTDAGLKENMGALKSVKSKIFLPRFEMTFQDNITEEITEAGLPLLSFDYGNISESVDAVVAYHGFNIKVDEEGAVIKSATAMSGMATGTVETPGPELRFDRPFIFAVYENSSNAILGLGIINDPAK